MARQLSDCDPSIELLIQSIYHFLGRCDSINITALTRLERDLGICGDDGIELLEAMERIFNIDFNYPNGFCNNFGLTENEYLFSAEGSNGMEGLTNILFRLLKRINLPIIREWISPPNPPVIRDLTVAELYQVICKIKLSV